MKRQSEESKEHDEGGGGPCNPTHAFVMRGTYHTFKENKMFRVHCADAGGNLDNTVYQGRGCFQPRATTRTHM